MHVQLKKQLKNIMKQCEGASSDRSVAQESAQDRQRRIAELPPHAARPLLAISEGQDSFLVDSIADANKYFSKVWPDGKEIDEPALVDAFIALVTATHKFAPKLQKVFDLLQE